MTTSTTMSAADFWAVVQTQHDPDDPDGNISYEENVGAFVSKVTGRGDLIAVYRNEDMGHPDLGLLQITSYGSTACQLERAQFPDGPPSTLPDIGGAINWRFQLMGVFDGAADA